LLCVHKTCKLLVED